MLEDLGLLRRPIVPGDCVHNAHMYHILLPSKEIRDCLIQHLKECGIHSVFHYVPLHGSKMGKMLGRVSGNLSGTVELSERLFRLPFWLGIEAHQEEISNEIQRGLLGG